MLTSTSRFCNKSMTKFKITSIEANDDKFCFISSEVSFAPKFRWVNSARGEVVTDAVWPANRFLLWQHCD